MKKFVLVFIFVFAAFGLHAGNHVVYTIDCPTAFTVTSTTIIGTSCDATNTCSYLVSISFIYKSNMNTDDYKSSVKLIKVSGFIADADPVINFKNSTFATDFQVETANMMQAF
jgi:hypothetical protein